MPKAQKKAPAGKADDKKAAGKKKAANLNMNDAGVAEEQVDSYQPSEIGEKLRQLIEENDNLRDKMLRNKAEFENYKKRRASDLVRLRADALEDVVTDLLSVVDDFELMLNNARNGNGAEAIISGAEMIRQKFLDLLRRRGLEKIEAEGHLFDPEVHEALLEQESAEVQPGIVLAVHQSGYKLAGKLLRPSRVIISKAPMTEEGEE